MLYTENKLIEYMNIQDEENALAAYDKMFKKLSHNCPLAQPCLRTSKTFILGLNAIISRNYYNKPVCKKMLYDIRLQFNKKIEAQTSVEKLNLLARQMISFYIDKIGNKNTLTRNPNINKAIDYIQNNLDREISLDEVAQSVFVSSTYLSHLFTKCMDMTFSQYVVKARIDRAKNLLNNTSDTVMDIALDCGFNSQSYFSNVFKKIEGMTPKEFRRLSKEGF